MISGRSRVLFASANIAPDIANRFVQTLTAQTTRLAKAPGMAAGTTPASSSEVESEVQTFGMPDPDDSDDTADELYDPNY